MNLFGKVTRVNTRYCFKYNEAIVFCVPMRFVSQAVGQGGKNIKKLNEILRKRIKVVAKPRGIQDAKKFIEAIVSPVKFNELDVIDNEIILNAGSHSKAALIGRNKRRLIEMQSIVRDFFDREFRIV